MAPRSEESQAASRLRSRELAGVAAADDHCFRTATSKKGALRSFIMGSCSACNEL